MLWAAARLYMRPSTRSGSVVSSPWRGSSEDKPHYFRALRISCKATMSAFTPGLLGPVATNESPCLV